MDLLHTGRFQGFCLVSSDSDFTRLATRIREFGLVVYGFGEKKTPQAFVAACDKFVFTEILSPEPTPTPVAVGAELEPLLRQAVITSAKDDGWAALSAVGSLISKNNPSFDPRNYGCQKLSELVRKQPYLEVKESPMGEGSNASFLHVRIR